MLSPEGKEQGKYKLIYYALTTSISAVVEDRQYIVHRGKEKKEMASKRERKKFLVADNHLCRKS